MNDFEQVLASYLDIEADELVVYQLLTGGLIHQTFEVSVASKELGGGIRKYVLQSFNHNIFYDPEGIARNMVLVANYQQRNGFNQDVLRPIENRSGRYMTADGLGRQWRLFPYLDNTVCYAQVPDLKVAYNAANLLGQYHKSLLGFKSRHLRVAIRDFCNFAQRIEDFWRLLHRIPANGFAENATNEIRFLISQMEAMNTLNAAFSKLPLRTIHGDPKISNFLFDAKDQSGRCLIDLDTLMSGSIMYDYGDMIRSFCNNHAEDNPAIEGKFNKEICQATTEGYLSVMFDSLTEEELAFLPQAPALLIYVQAVRFLTDYLSGDKYYSTDYVGQNLDRARGQIELFRGYK
jgi:Ser/Thr protein kinase RdoA (MazF antagonist)